MAQKVLNGFSIVAYATQPQGRTPPRAFIETSRLPGPPPAEGETPPPPEAPLVFEIFLSRRFRSTVEAMSAARNALDQVRLVTEEGVPDPMPDAAWVPPEED
ncbi:hypothetical protein [Bordetella hinzii]|uniref:Uncharacterized protein n=2 Tax=Bordetella hinzii TaxID=103855 RepID=A0AAN1RZU0_9BORD|nr:hypothetical protein [Bordetella hinzii]AKQ56098.1 hypothetical protein ACR54_02784 [Bordetella hinzii]AKQ60630.1 hypothetical protein ACR55_02763 [Bordetella hinzii]AZW18337.1 hypothetical protein CS347_16985 [Bordetella hinzii]KCB25709.1 hypothetical protein L543_1175 [Bordetella hinzii L60]KCB25773.1 hypothetical protein L544_1449 [Bordetella hinzii OH87 BAL007II]